MEEPQKNNVTAVTAVQGELFTGSDLINLERERIASFDRRTDVVKAAIEAEKENNDHAYQFHMRQLEISDGRSLREHIFGRRFLWSAFGVIAAAFTFLMYMSFFGAPDQREIAMAVLSTLFKGAAGAGIFVLLRQVWNKLFH